MADRSPARQIISRPAKWAVEKRIRERQLGFRMVQVLAVLVSRHQDGLPPLSLRQMESLLDVDRGNLSRSISALEKRGKVERFVPEGYRSPRIRLVA